MTMTIISSIMVNPLMGLCGDLIDLILFTLYIIDYEESGWMMVFKSLKSTDFDIDINLDFFTFRYILFISAVCNKCSICGLIDRFMENISCEKKCCSD